MILFSARYQNKVHVTLFICIAIFLSSCSQIRPIKITQDFAVSKLQTVHTLDVYADNNVIHTLLSGIDSNSQQLAVRYMNSSDAGETWSTPVTVNEHISGVKKSKRGNDFQVAASGKTVMAVWSTQGGEPWVGIISAALSLDMGQTWHKIPSPVSNDYSTINQGYYDLTADSQGKFYISWLDDREESGNTQGLRYASFQTDSSTWIDQSNLEPTSCTCCWSSMTTDTNGAVHVLYRDDSPRDMMLVSSFDGGQSWQNPQSVWDFNWTFMGCPHQGGGLATAEVNGKTNIHTVIWNGSEDKRGLYYRRLKLTGANDTPIIPLGDDSSVSGGIATIDDRVGLIYVTGTAENKRVVVKLSDDNGQSWQEDQALTTLGSKPSHPRIVGTPEGFRFFWTEWQDDGRAVAVMSYF